MAHYKKDSGAGVEKVRSVIDGLALNGTVTLAKTAQQLDTSPRTLQRRLNQQGMCFWSLVEQSRFKIAAALLRDTDLKVQEIAAKIVYRTPSTFARAFTRWAGRSPNEFRNSSKA